MSDDAKLSRRRFLRNAAFAGGGIYLVEWTWACKEEPRAPAKIAPPGASPHKAPLTTSHRVFTDAEFATLTACVDRILPHDQDVGGVETGVPEYFDRTFMDPNLHKLRDDFIAGLAAIDRASQRANHVPFAQATAEQKDALLRHYATMNPASGEAHFYETLVTFALEGFLGDPVYGGNKNRAGWALVGFDPGPPMPDHAGMPGMK